MLAGKIDFDSKLPFARLSPAHSGYVNIGMAETEACHLCLAVENDVSKRSVSELYWGQKITSAQHEALKKEAADWSLQSVLLEKPKDSRHVKITRNRRAECGLYVLATHEAVHLHWDPVRLYPYLDTSNPVDPAVAAAFLEMQSRYRCETVFKGLYLLPERGVALCQSGQVDIRRPQHVEPPSPVPLKANADPVGMLHDLVRASIARWPVDNAGAILSSGLDTTLVTSLLNEKISPRQLHSFGYWMLDAERDAVKSMRQQNVERLDLADYYPPVEKERDSLLDAGPWYPEQGATSFAEIDLARHMQSFGISLATTGIGGDELCMLSAAERSAMSLADHAPDQWEDDPYEQFSLLSPKTRSQAPEAGHFDWPVGYVGISTPCMANALGLTYLREGIWLAHPLADPEIQIFSQFLPLEWRQNRRLSREALLRLGCSDHFVRQVPKEDLSMTMESLMLGLDWNKIFKSPIVCDLGLIDLSKLKEAVGLFQKTRSIAIGIKIQQALLLELSLQSMAGRTTGIPTVGSGY